MSDEARAAELEQEHDPEASELYALLCELREGERLRRAPAEMAAFRFNGAQNLTDLLDDVGSTHSQSYGIYNPGEAEVFFSNLGPATKAAGALAVPGKAAIILPLATVGHVRLGIDPTALGEKEASIFRFKFASPQPFFFAQL